MKKLFQQTIDNLNTKEKNNFSFLVILHTIINIVDVISIVLLLVVIKFYTQTNSAALVVPFLLKYFNNVHSIVPILLLISLFIIKNIAGYYLNKKQFRFIYDVATNVSKNNLIGFLQGPYSNYINIDSSIFTRNILHQPAEFAQHVLLSFQKIITEIILIIFSITALLIYNTKLFAIVTITLLPPLIIVSYLTKKRIEIIKKNIKKIAEKSLQFVQETLNGYVESNIYYKNIFFINRHTKTQQTIGKHITNMQITQDLPIRFFEVFAVFGLFILIVAIQYQGSSNSSDLIILGSFIAAAYKIIPGISKIVNLTGQIKAYEYTVKNPNVSIIQIEKDDIKNKEKIISIEFKDVVFSYHENIILFNFNCTMKQGSFIGISGNSGKGKTTLLHLLVGFLTPDSGKILFNGNNTETNDRISFWDDIAYIKQKPFIVHESVLNNIVLFEDKVDHNKLNEVLNATGLIDIIKDFPNGLNEIIMENAKNISGGQCQRIAIARALYKNADTILLDEPFNELDESSELTLINYFKQLAEKGKMIVLITHSINSLQYCDTVIHF